MKIPVLLFSCYVLGGSVCAAAFAASYTTEASRVNLRSEPEVGQIIRSLAPKTPIKVLEKTEEAARVQIESGEEGWLPLRFVVEEETPSVPSAPIAQPVAASASPALRPAVQAASSVEKKKERTSPSPQQAQEMPVFSLFLTASLGVVVGGIAGFLIGWKRAHHRVEKRLGGLKI